MVGMLDMKKLGCPAYEVPLAATHMLVVWRQL